MCNLSIFLCPCSNEAFRHFCQQCLSILDNVAQSEMGNSEGWPSSLAGICSRQRRGSTRPQQAHTHRQFMHTEIENAQLQKTTDKKLLPIAVSNGKTGEKKLPERTGYPSTRCTLSVEHHPVVMYLATLHCLWHQPIYQYYQNYCLDGDLSSMVSMRGGRALVAWAWGDCCRMAWHPVTGAREWWLIEAAALPTAGWRGQRGQSPRNRLDRSPLWSPARGRGQKGLVQASPLRL